MYDKSSIRSEYSEREDYGNGYRKRYLQGLDKLIKQRHEDCENRRSEFAVGIAKDPEAYRKSFCDMLGWPLNEAPSPLLQVVENLVHEDEQCTIARMQFEVFEDFWFYGIAFRHKGTTPRPMVVCQHGGLGTPEFCSSFFDSSNYNDMSQRIFQKGMDVFAPQLLLWQEGRFGPKNGRVDIDNSLKQLGGSIASLEIYCISRCLDYFEQKNDVKTFGMAGLSYGGFYTLHTAAADVRIKAALACSHFNDRTKYNWNDKSWKNAASTFLDAEVGALVCPRFLRIEVGDNDELFDASTAITEYDRLKKYYTACPEHLEFNVFKGVHEFCPENDGIDQLVAALLK